MTSGSRNMVAVIRLKRRLDEDPTDTLILNCKKFKFEGSESPECTSTTFQLLGTISGELQDDGFPPLNGPVQFQKYNKLKSRDELQKSSRQKNGKKNKYKVMFCGKSEQSGITLNVEMEMNEHYYETVDSSGNEQCKYVVDVYTSSDDGDKSCANNFIMSEKAEYCSCLAEVIDCHDGVEDCNIESKYIVEYPDETYCEDSTKSNNEYLEIVEYMEGMALSKLPNIESGCDMT